MERYLALVSRRRRVADKNLPREASPPRPLKRRLGNDLVCRRRDRRLRLVYRGVCALDARGRLLACGVRLVRNKVELLWRTVFLIVLAQFVVRPRLGGPPEEAPQFDLKGRERDGYLVRCSGFSRCDRRDIGRAVAARRQ